MCYRPFQVTEKVQIQDLTFQSIEVNHKVPAIGMLVSDQQSKIALTGDTAKMDGFWEVINQQENLDALLIECAFPNELDELAHSSHHLTPEGLQKELTKFTLSCPIYIVNIKPMYRERIVSELEALKNPRLNIFQVGKIYEF
ncbi:MAG: hypothetical protein HC846_07475 [Blastocatellia bacterium]|nr:hypothetical protein [Blastocatellia bacterium]